MEPNENEQVADDLDVEEEDAEETPEAPTTETTDWEARAKRLEEKAIAQRERTRALKAEVTKLKKAQEQKAEPTPGELDTAAYAYLAVKGYEHEDDIKYIQQQMKELNKPLIEVLKKKHVIADLMEAKTEREVTAATPGSTKRSGTQAVDDVDYWYGKYEQSWDLPDNMPKGMAEKLVNRRYELNDVRKNPFE